ncbi:MAG: type II methionyl aminopeptidase [Candidatus Heimdallarchaeota archaeon]|nr:type II methionyl aminopeptidase [Candidatus Heimdallarchaeota archaeon]
MSTKTVKIQEILEKYRLAGEIAKGAKKIAREVVKPGANTYEIAQRIEKYMYKKGARPAFPTNISFDREAAHYSPEILDERNVGKESIVKVDLGAHIDGYIVDTAITLNFNPQLEELTKASKAALENVIDAVKPGIRVSELGKIVETTINDFGYEPVRNLSGHQIKRYNLHAGVNIPNCGPGYFERDNAKLEAGRVYAIEPFASTGVGMIKNGTVTNIFRFINKPRGKYSHLKEIYDKYTQKVGVLPFSPRMVYDPETGVEGKNEVMKNLRELKQAKAIMGYPVLIEERKNAMISQHEHTVRVTKDGAEVFT